MSPGFSSGNVPKIPENSEAVPAGFLAEFLWFRNLSCEDHVRVLHRTQGRFPPLLKQLFNSYTTLWL